MDCHLCLAILQILLIVRLDRDHVLGLLVGGASHNSECTLTHLEIYLEVFQLERLLIRILLSSGVDHLSEVT